MYHVTANYGLMTQKVVRLKPDQPDLLLCHWDTFGQRCTVNWQNTVQVSLNTSDTFRKDKKEADRVTAAKIYFSAYIAEYNISFLAADYFN